MQRCLPTWVLESMNISYSLSFLPLCSNCPSILSAAFLGGLNVQHTWIVSSGTPRGEEFNPSHLPSPTWAGWSEDLGTGYFSLTVEDLRLAALSLVSSPHAFLAKVGPHSTQ